MIWHSGVFGGSDMISMLPQMLFPLACGHDVLLGRLAHSKAWTCEICGKPTDLSAGSYKAALEHNLEAANRIDLHAKTRSETIERLG